jgi:hypothetical protein
MVMAQNCRFRFWILSFLLANLVRCVPAQSRFFFAGALGWTPYCLQSIKVFSFVILNCAFKVWDENLEDRSGQGGGWFVIAECKDDPENPLQEPFTLEIACELIGETEHKEGIQVIKQDGE